MTAIAMVYVTFAGTEEAETVARTVVAERLAACANILGACKAIYHWQGKIEDGTEVATLFKTRPGQCEALIARIAELHSYEVPSITAWTSTDAHTPFSQWVTEETT